MATLSAVPTPHVQVCPPHAAWLIEKDEPQFFHRHVPVVTKARLGADHESHSETGLDFGDANRMNVSGVHMLARGRKSARPEYALSNALLRKLLVFTWERRAHIRDGVGTDLERLQAAHAKLLDTIQILLDRMDNLCRELVASTDPHRRRILTNQIRTLDAQIMHVRRGPSISAAIVAWYHRNGWDSVRIAEELGTTSTFIRQQLHRLSRDYDRMTGKLPVRKVNGRRRLKPGLRRAFAITRLARAEAVLAELQAGRERFIEERVAKSKRRYEKRRAKAEADVQRAQEQVLTLAKGVLCTMLNCGSERTSRKAD